MLTFYLLSKDKVQSKKKAVKILESLLPNNFKKAIGYPEDGQQ